MTDWYENSNLLEPDMVFRDYQGSIVKLDRPVPGDGTKWYVADWDSYHCDWSYYDSTIEPSDLTELIKDFPDNPTG